MASGVYEIRNLINDRVYIGSTAGRGLKKRWSDHLNNLKNKKHPNKYLQNAWNKSGKGNFEFSILLFCAPENCLLFEQRCLDYLQPFPWTKKGYNISPTAKNSWGIVRSEEFKQKISKSLMGNKRCLGNKPSKETKEKTSKSMKGYQNALNIKPNNKTRKKLSSLLMGNERNAKPYPSFIGPDGTIYPPGINLAAFCRKHRLSKSNMYLVLWGKYKQNKGWKLSTEK